MAKEYYNCNLCILQTNTLRAVTSWHSWFHFTWQLLYFTCTWAD